MVKQKLISWVAVILWMALIFIFSNQPSETSSSMSIGITEQILEVVESLLPGDGIDKETMHTFVRKNAHFFVYLMLGILSVNAFRKSGFRGWRSTIAAFALCVLYAISDETHQLFISGRSGEARDVLIDSSGAAAGIGIYYFAKKLFSGRKAASNYASGLRDPK